VEVTRQWVIDGGYVKKSLALPTVDIPGIPTPCTPIGANTAWVHQVLEGKCRDATLSAKIIAWHSAVKAALVKASSHNLNMLRDQLCMSSSGSESDGDHIRSPAHKRVKKQASLLEITVGGHTFRAVNLRRVVYLPLTSEDIGNALKAVDFEEPPPDERKRACWLSAQRMPTEEELTDGDKGKIFWIFGRRCWSIKYQGEDGKLSRLSAGLVPPNKDFADNPLSAEAFLVAKYQSLQKARKKWNELDKSGTERLSIQ